MWTDIVKSCEDAIANPTSTLASVTNEETNDFLLKTILVSVSRAWAWSDGSQSGPHAPNKAKGNYGHFDFDEYGHGHLGTGVWSDVKDDYKIPSICQYNPNN